MIASKLIISTETRKRLSNPVLSPMKKRQLREDMIIECIRKAAGEAITKQQLMVAAGYDSKYGTSGYSQGFTLISSMINRGIISHNGTKSFKKVWTCNADVKVKKPATPVAEAPKADTKMESLDASATIMQNGLDQYKKSGEVVKKYISDRAKDFVWEKNSDSLREFLKYIETSVQEALYELLIPRWVCVRFRS